MGVARSSSATQIHRKISGSLVGLQQQQQQQQQHHHHHQKKYSNAHRKWAARAAVTICLLIVLLYLGIYLYALSAALNKASGTKNLPKTGNKVLSVKDMQQQNAEPKPVPPAVVEAEPAVMGLLRKGQAKQQQQQPAAPATLAGPKGMETLVLSTKRIGDIRIVLRPDLSKESVDYVKQVVATQSCHRCNLYRAEKPGILQGILSSLSVPQSTAVTGRCPPGYETVQNDCPEWDANCGCHGPTMTRGMVGWAAGKAGPDFFIDNYAQPAAWWGTQHTVWGELRDAGSFAALDAVWALPTHAAEGGGITYLDEPLHFELRLENTE